MRPPPELLAGRWQHVTPAATTLVWAVRTGNRREIERALSEALKAPGGMRALVLVLAGMVPDDERPSDLLGWLTNPSRYLKLREEGLNRTDAMAVLRLKTG